MILDKRVEFADDVAITTTGANATKNIGNQIDLSVSGLNIGTVDDIFVVIEVGTAITSTGAATVDFRLVSGDAAAISTTGAARVHYTTGALAKTTLVKGYQVAFPLPRGDYKRYLGVQTVSGTQLVKTGKINAYLVNQPPFNKAYKRGD